MNGEIVDIIIKLISQLGFPIFVAVWLLVKTDKLLSENTKALKDLKEVLQSCLGNVIKEGKEDVTPNPNPRRS